MLLFSVACFTIIIAYFLSRLCLYLVPHPTFQSALKNAFSGRTVVIVAHRLATIQDADRVVVLKNGSVLEDGPPAELRSRPGGAFAELLQKQSLVLA